MASTYTRDKLKTKEFSPAPVLPGLLRLVILVLVDAFVIWFLTKLIPLGYFPLAAAVVIVAVFVNVVMLVKAAYPIRWMIVGLVLLYRLGLHDELWRRPPHHQATGN